MGYHHEFSDNIKQTDTLERSLADVICPAVIYQGYVVKTTTEAITWQDQTMFMATDQGLALSPNDLLTHSDTF